MGDAGREEGAFCVERGLEQRLFADCFFFGWRLELDFAVSVLVL